MWHTASATHIFSDKIDLDCFYADKNTLTSNTFGSDSIEMIYAIVVGLRASC